MKKFILSSLFIGVFVVCSFGQITPPATTDNGNIADNGIKMRSIELERAKREAAQAEAASFAPINTEIKAKFPQIKEDFEGIQMAQAAIITAYTKTKTIDYAMIESSANEINKNSKRLDSNLFALTKKEKKDDKKSDKEEKPKTIRDLIVELDNAIGDFVSSKIFGNLKVIEPEVAIKTRTDLLKVQDLSEKLAAATKNLK